MMDFLIRIYTNETLSDVEARLLIEEKLEALANHPKITVEYWGLTEDQRRRRGLQEPV